VNVPLDATYNAAFEDLPKRWKAILEWRHVLAPHLRRGFPKIDAFPLGPVYSGRVIRRFTHVERNRPMLRRLLLATLAVLFAQGALMAQEKTLIYVGTYTGKTSKGIYLFEMDKNTGKLTERGLVAETPNPTFLAIHPNKKFLYAVSEIGNFGGKSAGAVAAFAIDPKDNSLKLLNKQSSGGSGPCHVSMDKAGKNVFVANYGGGSVAMLPVKDDGSLGEATSFIQHTGSSVNPGRQKEPHAHSINLDPAGKYAFAADLGTDMVYVYKVDPANGTLTKNAPAGAKLAPGSGPRHFAFHPNGKHAFVINELLLTLTSFNYDPDSGTLNEIETISTLPDNTTNKGFSTAEVVVHPSGKWVLGSNRTHDSIAVFAFDEAKGSLTRVGNYGDTVKVPRNFVIDPTGNFVLVGNQAGDSITVFRMNQQTGELTRVGDPTPCPTPVCLRFVVQ
jgi:6-phosphogluconolactonase